LTLARIIPTEAWVFKAWQHDMLHVSKQKENCCKKELLPPPSKSANSLSHMILQKKNLWKKEWGK
jgi:hypothetical protein